MRISASQIRNHQARQAKAIEVSSLQVFQNFLRLTQYADGTKLGKVRIATRCEPSYEDAVMSNDIVNVEFSIHNGYLVGQKDSFTVLSNGRYETISLPKDNLFEIAFQANPAFKRYQGDFKDSLVIAIADAAQSAVFYDVKSAEQVLNNLFPVLNDSGVRVEISLDDIPSEARLVGKVSFRSLEQSFKQDRRPPISIAKNLNDNHIVLIGASSITFFEYNAAA